MIIKGKWFYIFLVGLVLTSLVFIYHTLYQKERRQHQRWKSNYVSVVQDTALIHDRLRRAESRVDILSLHKKELMNNLYAKDSRLKRIKEELTNSKVKLKRLQDALYMQIMAKDTGVVQIIDTVFIEKEPPHQYLAVNDSNLFFEAWWKHRDSVDYNYLYQEDILYWTELERKLYNGRGQKRFFLWRWLWPNWRKRTYIKSMNKNSRVNAIKVHVED